MNEISQNTEVFDKYLEDQNVQLERMRGAMLTMLHTTYPVNLSNKMQTCKKGII